MNLNRAADGLNRLLCSPLLTHPFSVASLIDAVGIADTKGLIIGRFWPTIANNVVSFRCGGVIEVKLSPVGILSQRHRVALDQPLSFVEGKHVVVLVNVETCTLTRKSKPG